MPLYDYRCTSCGKTTEVRHGFDEKHTAPCPHCGSALARVFNPAPIVFKGSGFYINDSRPAKSSDNATSTSTETKTEAKVESKSDTPAVATESKSETESETKSETKTEPKSESPSGSAV